MTEPSIEGDIGKLDPGQTCWITVGNLAVRVHRADEGVVVDVYPDEDVMRESLGSTWVLFSEAEEEE